LDEFLIITADELGGDDLGGAGEEGFWEVLGERGGYGSGLTKNLRQPRLDIN